MNEPHDRHVKEFLLRTDRALTPLAEKLRQHGAVVAFAMLVGEPEWTTAYVLMPEGPQDAEECRQIIEDWNA